jgi:hypothetical protein
LKNLTEAQAYAAMFAFLEQQYDLRKSDEIGALLGSLSTLPDGGPVDPAVAADWAVAVERAVTGRVQLAMQLTRAN